MMEPEKRRSDFEEILAVILMVISCFFAFTYFLTTVLGPVIFFFTQEGAAVSVMHMNGLPVWLFAVIFFRIPVMPNAGEVFLFLAGVFFLCLLAAWKFRESFYSVVRRGSLQPLSKMFNNFLISMPIITSMLLVAVLAIINLQSSAGLPTTPSPEVEKLPPFVQFFEFSYAVLIEEIGFRISPIGLFLIIRVLEAQIRNGMVLSGWEWLKLFFTALIYPDKAKKTVGLKTVSDSGIRKGISRGEWVMIFLTALAFGSAHFLSRSWTVGKITSGSVTGLALGLVYMAYGAYAPILLHWFFNYYTWILFNENAIVYYPFLLLVSNLAALLIFAIGIGGWIAFAIMGVKKLLNRKARPLESLPLTSNQSRTVK